MRHRNTGRQFGRNSSHRRALFRNLVTSLLEHGKVETTEAKAKEIRGIADKMITLGKRGDLHAKRMALAYIQSRDVVAKLFSEIAPRSASRNGGYTRVIKTRVRLGDSAPMAVIELVDREGAAPSAPKKAREAAPAAAEAPKKAPAKAAAPAVAAAPAEAPVEAPAETAAAPEAEAPTAEAAKPEAAPEAPAEGEEKQ